MASINDIVSQVTRHQFARAYNYEVRILGKTDKVGDAPREVMFNCNSVLIPGINVNFSEHKRYNFGITSKYPMSKSFEMITMNFYETEHEMEREYFVNWVNSIYNKTTEKVSFYDSIVKDITIIQYDRTKTKTYECKLIEAFPSNIASMERSYSITDTISSFSVQFQFKDLQETFGFFRR